MVPYLAELLNLQNIKCMHYYIPNLDLNQILFTCLCYHNCYFGTGWLESVQDFLIKLDMKPGMDLVEISIFSLNLVIVRPTKIMNKALKVWKICTFKVILRKSTESF